MADSIPVIAVPILNHPDLFRRMLKSIDHPVDRLYVIDNGGVVDRIKAPTAKNVHVCDPGYNMGVAGSWNLAIRANVDAPWWAFLNVDIILQPGALARLAEHMWANADRPTVAGIEMGNEKWGNHFGAHAVNHHALRMIGWFDENFHPIYYEDTDYRQRMEYYGMSFDVIESTTHHDGNQSWKDVPVLAAANKVSWDFNRDYYDEKHGKLLDATYELPWGDKPVWFWTPPSIDRLRSTQWPLPARSNWKKDGSDVRR